LFVKSISATNFRNFRNLEFCFKEQERHIIIKSPNGTGKTNFLELLYYFTYLKSFRAVSDGELINKGENYFSILINYDNDEDNEISVKYLNKSKEVVYNNKKIKRYSEIFGKYCSVVFSSDDMLIIKGNPNYKRKFFDMFFSIIDIEYFYSIKNYNCVLKQKNALLKNKSFDKKLLEIYNYQLAQYINIIQQKRDEFIKITSKDFNDKYLEIGDYNYSAKIIYYPSIKIKEFTQENIFNFLMECCKKEVELGFSFYGVHKDNYQFLLNNLNFNSYASFGQTRLASLIMKTIQADNYKKYNNISPILLLDDVILELDNYRKVKFVSKIFDYKQFFITISDDTLLKIFEKSSYLSFLEIIDGKIQKSNFN